MITEKKKNSFIGRVARRVVILSLTILFTPVIVLDLAKKRIENKKAQTRKRGKRVEIILLPKGSLSTPWNNR